MQIRYDCGCTIEVCQGHSIAVGSQIPNQNEINQKALEKSGAMLKEALESLDQTRCIEPISKDGWATSEQCSRSRGKGRDGLYCGQHAKQHPAL